MYLCDDLFVCLCLCLCLGVFVFVFVCGCGCVCVYLRKKTMRREVNLFCTKKREKKGAKCEINKIIVYTSYNNRAYSNRAYMHDYCNKCVNMHSFRRTDVEDF